MLAARYSQTSALQLISPSSGDLDAQFFKFNLCCHDVFLFFSLILSTNGNLLLPQTPYTDLNLQAWILEAPKRATAWEVVYNCGQSSHLWSSDVL